MAMTLNDSVCCAMFIMKQHKQPNVSITRVVTATGRSKLDVRLLFATNYNRYFQRGGMGSWTLTKAGHSYAKELLK